eukprot:UN27473
MYQNGIRFKRKIGALHIKCMNHNKGCTWSNSLNQHDKHLSNCLYEIIMCTLEPACGMRLERGKILQHEHKRLHEVKSLEMSLSLVKRLLHKQQKENA